MSRRPRALRSPRTDEGFTLVEVIVAMVVFGLVSTGILTSANIVIRMTSDNRSREVAVNLAEQQLDTDRGILDPFDVHNIPVSAGAAPLTQTVSGRTYTITQTTSLVGVDGGDITCGSSKTISYRRISVQVDWTGRLATTSPVQSDTILAPDGRINDSSTGSIAVLVLGATGAGENGVTVSVTPNGNGASALTSQPAPTDVDGCAYAFGLTPGTYKVSISKPDSKDPAQIASPSAPNDTTVTAGATSPVAFSYDQTATYPLTFAPGANATLPDSMAITALSQGQPYNTSATASAPTSVSLYPWPTGYSIVAGRAAKPTSGTVCAAEDPTAWGAAPGVKAAARATATGQQPGATSPSVAVPMGVFTVKVPPLTVGTTTITASGQSSTANGQPGCATPETFTFTVLLGPGRTGTFALPYGTYQLSSSGFSFGATTAAVPTSTYNGPLSSVTSSGLLTLDPRPAS